MPLHNDGEGIVEVMKQFIRRIEIRIRDDGVGGNERRENNVELTEKDFRDDGVGDGVGGGEGEQRRLSGSSRPAGEVTDAPMGDEVEQRNSVIRVNAAGVVIDMMEIGPGDQEVCEFTSSSRAASVSASGDSSKVKGIQQVISLIQDAFYSEPARVVPDGVSRAKKPASVQGAHARQVEPRHEGGKFLRAVDFRPARTGRSGADGRVDGSTSDAAQPSPARDRVGGFNIQREESAAETRPCVARVMQVAPAIQDSRVTAASFIQRGDPVTESRFAPASVVQDAPAVCTGPLTKLLDRKLSVSPGAERPDSDVDRSVGRRRGLHRLQAQQLLRAGPTDGDVAVSAAGTYLAEDHEIVDVEMTDVNRAKDGRASTAMERMTTDAEMARDGQVAGFEGCAGTTDEVVTADARGYVDNVLPYVDDKGMLHFECHAFSVKERFLLFYAAHRANERVIRAVALSLKESSSVAEWMQRLEAVIISKGKAINVIRIFIADGIEIWETAVAARQRRLAVEIQGARCAQEAKEVKDLTPMDVEYAEPSKVEPVVSGVDAVTEEVKMVRAVVAAKPPGILMQTIAHVRGLPETIYNDSGADVSCVSSAVAARLDLAIKTTRVAVFNPNGTPFTVRGVAVVPLQFGGKSFDFPFQVLDDLDVGILVGDDFLRHFKCTMSYGAGFVEYDGIPVSTVQAGTSKNTLRMYRSTDGLPVELCEEVILGSGQTFDVIGKVKLPAGFPYRTHTWIFEPLLMTEAALGVAAAPAVVKLEGVNTVRVRLADRRRSTAPVVLPVGTVLGTIHTVRKEAKALEQVRVIRALRTSTAGPGRAALSEDGILIHANAGEIQNASVVEGANEAVREGGDEWAPANEAEFQIHLAKILQQLPETLTGEERQALADTLTEYKRSLCPVRLGCAKDVIVDINPGEARPVCHPDRRWSPQEGRAIREQIEGLLAAGLIEPSDSPWSNRLVCAPKKGSDGTKTEIRVCVDFRDVNARCVKDAYPAPNIDATLDQLNRAAWYSSVDLAKGYHQVPLTERAKQICSFRCPSGFFRYTRMPFGIMNAPAAFQRMMDVVLRDFAWKFCMVYIDDVIIYSTSWADHVDHISHVLRRIRDAGLTVGLKKCHFGGREVAFLGYIVSAMGIKPDPTKVAAIRDFKVPESLTDLRSFLGLASQFRRFIRCFGDMARPLQFLTRKEAHGLWVTGHAWTEERIMAFDAIKAAVAEEVTLAHPCYDRPLLMVCDASDYGMGAMLAQLDDQGNERPIAFTSATFYGPALRYTTTEKEGLAVVWAAAHFRPYIHGVPTVVVTDHAALTWILSRGDPPARIAHWVMDLSQYDLTYVHRKGAHNNVADALSRLQGKMDTVDAVDGGGEMPETCVLHTITTRQRKKKTAQSSPPTSSDTTATTAALADSRAQGSFGALLPTTELSTQPPQPSPATREVSQVDTSVGMEGVEAVSCEGEVVVVVESTQAKAAKQSATSTSEPILQQPTFWVEANRDGVKFDGDLTTEEVISSQLKDTELRAMRNFIQNGVLPDDPSLRAWVLVRGDEFLLQAGVLMKAEQVRVLGKKTVRLVMAVPKDLRWRVVEACHDSSAYGGHMDATRTCSRVKRYFWWSRLFSDVYDYVGGCLVCRSAAKRTAGPAPLGAHEVPSRPFEFLGIDLIAMPESSYGNKYAMVVMDHFSRYATVVAIQDKTAVTVARMLTRHVILIHGPPSTLLSDQGGEFDNALMRELASVFGFKKISTTPYRPQCDGLVERFNRTLLRLLRCFVDTSQANWDDLLPYVLFSYNTAISSTTGEAPFSIVFGRDPPAPIFSDVLDASGAVRRIADPAEWRREVQEALSDEFMEELVDFNRETKEKRNRVANERRKVRSWFRPGLVVLLANNQKLAEGARPKLARKQRGLFVIVRMVTEVTAELRKVGDAGRSLTKVHIDLLEPVRTGANKVLVLSSPFPPTVEAVDDAEDAEDEVAEDTAEDTASYEVESVVAVRSHQGQLQLKVHWKGYATPDDSWLAEADLDCPRLIEEFIATSGENLRRISQ